jgi:hypothetical protein
VPRTTSLTACSCQYLDCYGVPCRHTLLLYSIQQMACLQAVRPKALRQELPP